MFLQIDITCEASDKLVMLLPEDTGLPACSSGVPCCCCNSLENFLVAKAMSPSVQSLV